MKFLEGLTVTHNGEQISLTDEQMTEILGRMFSFLKLSQLSGVDVIANGEALEMFELIIADTIPSTQVDEANGSVSIPD